MWYREKIKEDSLCCVTYDVVGLEYPTMSNKS